MKMIKYAPRCATPGFPLDSTMSDMLNDLMGWDRGGAMTGWAPHVDVLENDDNYEIRAELPGLKESEISITLNNNVLTLSGEKKQEITDEQDNYIRVERTYGKFERSFSLPTNIVADKVDADYKDGVLTISIPKADDAKSRTIKIKR